MPNLSVSAGPSPSLRAMLNPIAASPIAREGEPGSFTGMIASVASDPLMLDLPPVLPGTGTELPVTPLQPAGPIEPLPEIDVAEVMVGCGWQPESPYDVPVIGGGTTPVANLRPFQPVPGDVPEEPINHAPFKKPVMLGTTAMPPILTPITPTAAKDVPASEGDQPEIEKPAIAVLTIKQHPQIVVPVTTGQPAPIVQPAPAPMVSESVNADEAPVASTPVVTPRHGDGGPVQQQPMLRQSPNGQPSAPELVLDNNTAEPPTPAPLTPFTPTAFAPIARPTAAPSEPAPAQPAPINVASPPADLRIAPELARQIAQMLQPAEPIRATPVESAMIEPTAAFASPAPQPVAASAPVAFAPPTASAPIDLGRSEWIQSMIDRIAELPQAEGRREASIRLLPDALGAIEVRVVERDKQMHVTLTADTAQARQMLSDAAPRLQELAEARGLRFAQTDVGGGQSQERRPAPEQQAFERPRPATADRSEDPSTPGDLIA